MVDRIALRMVGALCGYTAGTKVAAREYDDCIFFVVGSIVLIKCLLGWLIKEWIVRVTLLYGA